MNSDFGWLSLSTTTTQNKELDMRVATKHFSHLRCLDSQIGLQFSSQQAAPRPAVLRKWSESDSQLLIQLGSMTDGVLVPSRQRERERERARARGDRRREEREERSQSQPSAFKLVAPITDMILLPKQLRINDCRLL